MFDEYYGVYILQLRVARFDRATVVATAILQIVRGALIAWLHGEHADMAGTRAAIEAYLRDELPAALFEDFAMLRTALAKRGLHIRG